MIRTVDANGLRFAYLEEGEGPLVLMLHGFPDTPKTWEHARPALAEAGYRVVTPFMRGYAPSEIPRDGRYDMLTLGRDAVALCEALSGGEKAILVGHDWGSLAGYAAASLAPDRLRLLVTMALPHPAAIRPTPRLMWVFRHALALQLPGASKRMRAKGLAYLDTLLQRWSPTWQVPADETEAVKAALSPPGAFEAAAAYYKAISTTLPPPLRARLQVPTVTFHGTADPNTPLEMFERARSRIASSYELVAMPGGHFLHREHPAHFVRELLRVVRAAPPP